jgi:hypothetical protein
MKKRILINLTVIWLFSCAISGCVGYSKFYNLGDGFRYGFYDTKKTSNVFYKDQGIIHGICNSVEWNDEYILMKCELYLKGGILTGDTSYFLIDKNEYKKYPFQTESRGTIGPFALDSIRSIINRKQIKFTETKTLGSPEEQ